MVWEWFSWSNLHLLSVWVEHCSCWNVVPRPVVGAGHDDHSRLRRHGAPDLPRHVRRSYVCHGRGENIFKRFVTVIYQKYFRSWWWLYPSQSSSQTLRHSHILPTKKLWSNVFFFSKYIWWLLCNTSTDFCWNVRGPTFRCTIVTPRPGLNCPRRGGESSTLQPSLRREKIGGIAPSPRRCPWPSWALYPDMVSSSIC